MFAFRCFLNIEIPVETFGTHCYLTHLSPCILVNANYFLFSDMKNKVVVKLIKWKYWFLHVIIIPKYHVVDSCDICECMGLFLLAKIKEFIDNGKISLIAVALYCDDLILVAKKHVKLLNEIKSKSTKIFKNENLILWEWTEGIEQNHLHVEFNLHENTHKPSKKNKMIQSISQLTVIIRGQY